MADTLTGDDPFGRPGYYLFPGLSAGDYFVAFELPDGFNFTAADGAGDTADSDVGPGGRTAVFTLGDKQLDLTRDAGLTLAAGSLTLGDRVWDDRDNDGRYEHATVFASGLNFPNGVLASGGGLLVTAAPDILFLKDTDGDGVADEKTVVFTGFNEGNQQLRANGLTWGLDNWIYGANGRSDGQVRRPSDPAENAVSIRGRDFRFTPDGRQDPLFISNYASINVVDALKRVAGVGDVQIFGAQVYAMRIWLQPNRMAELGVTTSDVAAAIREQNSQFAAGQIGQEPIRSDQQLTYTVTTKGRLVEPEEFGNIIVRANPDASMLRLKDFARYRLTQVKTCFYDVEPRERFIVEKIGRVGWVMSGFSGHGFKFGPLIALELARAIAGESAPPALSAWAAGALDVIERSPATAGGIR